MHDITSEDIIFRPHYLGYLIALGVILGLGAACLTLAAHQHPYWLAGAGLAGIWGFMLTVRYTAGAIIIRGLDLVFVRGVLTIREVSLPIWEARLDTRQGLVGRLFDEGVVAQQIGGERVAVRVAQLRALRRLVTERRLRILGLANESALLMLAEPSR